MAVNQLSLFDSLLLSLLSPRKFRVYRVKFANVKVGHAFTYRGIAYIKGIEPNTAYRVLKGKVRVMAPDINVRPVVRLEWPGYVPGTVDYVG